VLRNVEYDTGVDEALFEGRRRLAAERGAWSVDLRSVCIRRALSCGILFRRPMWGMRREEGAAQARATSSSSDSR